MGRNTRLPGKKNLLAPRRVKDPEFDHVVVVEPALIADGETGLHEL